MTATDDVRTAGASVDDRDRPTPPVTRALLVASGVVTGFWLVIVLVWPDAVFAMTFDDAWYYLGIARNVAEGNGSTFDGMVTASGTNLTNGYHPLWLLVATLAFVVGLDDLAAARALLALQVVVGLGASLALLSLAIGKVLDGWLAVPARGDRWSKPDGVAAWSRMQRRAAGVLGLVLVAVAGNPFVVKAMTNLMESGIVITFDAALLYLAVRHRGRFLDGTSTAWRWGVGVLVAGAFLARTDGVLTAGALGLWWLAEAVYRSPTRTRARAVAAVVPLATPVVVVGIGYLVINQRLFGTAQQVSGLVKRRDLTPTTVAILLAVAAVAGMIGVHGWRRAHGRPPRPGGRFPRAGDFASRTAWFAATCIGIVAYYSVLQTQQWPWYYAPLLLYGTALAVLAAADITTVAVSEVFVAALPDPALAPVAVGAAVLLVGGFAYTGPQFADPNLRSIQVANAEAGRWLAANVPDDAVVLSWDAGALGYFSGRHVFNLDGVANSYDYYEALRDGRPWPAELIGCDQRVFLANHGADVGGEDPGNRTYVAAVFGPEVAAAARPVHALPFTYSGVAASSSGFASDPDAPRAVHVLDLGTPRADDPDCR